MNPPIPPIYRFSKASESCLFCTTDARNRTTVRLQRLCLLRKYANQVVAPTAIKRALHKQKQEVKINLHQLLQVQIVRLSWKTNPHSGTLAP